MTEPRAAGRFARGAVRDDPDLVATLGRALEGRPGARPGQMFGHPAWFAGPRLFACVVGEVVGLKLPADMVGEILCRAGFSPFRPYGHAAMRGWVASERRQALGFRADPSLVIASFDFVCKEKPR